MAQEVFVLVYRKIDTFRHDSGFSTWHLRLTRNRVIDRSRKARMRHHHVGDENLRSMPSQGTYSDPELAAAAGERRTAVLQHVQRLPDPQRTVIYLYYWIGSGVADLAELPEMNVQTVESHFVVPDTDWRRNSDPRGRVMPDEREERTDRMIRDAFAATARPSPSPHFGSKLRVALAEEKRRRRAARTRLRIMQAY